MRGCGSRVRSRLWGQVLAFVSCAICHQRHQRHSCRFWQKQPCQKTHTINDSETSRPQSHCHPTTPPSTRIRCNRYPAHALDMSTRIFVRGLPPTFTDNDFKSHFAKQGAVTDSKLISHRRIGYVGYKTPEEAQAAVKYFNKSFIRMSRIAVEIARPVADEALPRAWSAHTPGTTAYQRKHEAKTGSAQGDSSLDKTLKRKRCQEDDTDAKPIENDAKLKEFLEVMKPQSKSKTWGNDDLALLGQDGLDTDVPVMTADAGKSDDEYEEVPAKQKKKQKSSQIEPLPKKQGVDLEDNNEGETSPTALDQRGEGPVSDADWLRSRTSRLLDLTDDVDAHLAQASATKFTQSSGGIQSMTQVNEDGIEFDQSAEETPEDIDEKPPGKLEEEATINTISENGRLFLRNLSYSTTEEDLRQNFLPFGELEEVHLPVDNKTQTSKGFAYILFKTPLDAVEAFKGLDRKIFQGRILHILAAAPKRENKLDEFALSKLPLKKQRELKRKATAASSQFNWNSMYMNADAVMSSVADRLGVSKADLLDPTSSDAAVKQAHAETHVIQETKAYFKLNGMDLAAFEKREKDDCVILVKNFPYGTKIGELKKLVSDFGKVQRVLMPPAGTIAVVEFLSAPSARAAFAGLAYRRFKESILFLEKAPKGLFIEGFDPNKSLESAIATPLKELGKKAKVSVSDLLQATPVEEAELVDTTTLFVRNLNFCTTTDRLADLFGPIDGFLSARVKTKTDPKKPGQTLSMGFGFIEFKSKSQAQAALAAMDGYVLDNHKLLINSSHKGLDAAAERKKEDNKKKEAGKRTKIIIKNLPFEASKKDVTSLLSQYGTLRSVRLPKKFGGVTRGFAFAEFVTAREAENAMESLKDTHLLGRRLVLEFAAQDAANAEEEIERMGKKVARQTDMVALARLKAVTKRKVELDESGDVMDED